MAILHPATVTPTKLELIAEWAPTQPWFVGDIAAELTLVGSFRFDDRDGEVGIETLLVQAGTDAVMQIPLTYRGAPLVGGEAWLMGTMQHSVLGPRWVYDAVGDPAYIAETSSAIFTGGTEAEQFLDRDGTLEPRESTVTVRGSGSGARSPIVLAPAARVEEVSTRNDGAVTEVVAGSLHLAVARVLPTNAPDLLARASSKTAERELLVGTWATQSEPHTLVEVWSAA